MAREIDDIAIIRIEQLYPFDKAGLAAAIRPYTKLRDVVWCQEEPMNQGVWFSSQHRFVQVVHEHNPKLVLGYVGRESSAAPASGYMSVHLEEQNKFLNQALTL
jgi:2-oxoglutarate dehydrogenase E1 component